MLHAGLEKEVTIQSRVLVPLIGEVTNCMDKKGRVSIGKFRKEIQDRNLAIFCRDNFVFESGKQGLSFLLYQGEQVVTLEEEVGSKSDFIDKLSTRDQLFYVYQLDGGFYICGYADMLLKGYQDQPIKKISHSKLDEQSRITIPAEARWYLGIGPKLERNVTFIGNTDSLKIQNPLYPSCPIAGTFLALYKLALRYGL